jgi:hypothetical protein
MSCGVKLNRKYQRINIDSLPKNEDIYFFFRAVDSVHAVRVFPNLLGTVDKAFLQRVVDGQASHAILQRISDISEGSFRAKFGGDPPVVKIRKEPKKLETIKDFNERKWNEEKYNKALEKVNEGFENKDGVLYWKDKRVVREEEIEPLLEQIYLNSHTAKGRDALYNYVKEHYVGISRRRIDQYIKKKKLETQ